jgi:hypothetical protein
LLLAAGQAGACAEQGFGLSVNIFAMSERNNCYNELSVFYFVNNSIVANANTIAVSVSNIQTFFRPNCDFE